MVSGDIKMKNESVFSITSGKIDVNGSNEKENLRITLAIVSSKICEIKNITKSLNENEIKYFVEMIEIVVRDKLAFLSHDYH